MSGLRKTPIMVYTVRCFAAAEQDSFGAEATVQLAMHLVLLLIASINVSSAVDRGKWAPKHARCVQDDAQWDSNTQHAHLALAQVS